MAGIRKVTAPVQSVMLSRSSSQRLSWDSGPHKAPRCNERGDLLFLRADSDRIGFRSDPKLPISVLFFRWSSCCRR